MLKTLELHQPGEKVTTIEISEVMGAKDWLTIGRGKPLDRDNHISLAPATYRVFSRSHCTIRRGINNALIIRDGGPVLRHGVAQDKPSNFGTWVNHVRLKDGQGLELLGGDCITFCSPHYSSPVVRQYRTVVVNDSTISSRIAESQFFAVKQVFWGLARDTEAGLAILNIETPEHAYIMPDCINDDAADVLGRAGDELRHTSNVFHSLFLEVETLQKQLKEVIETEGSYRGEFTAVADNGDFCPVGLSISYYPINKEGYLRVTLRPGDEVGLIQDDPQPYPKTWPQLVYELAEPFFEKHPILSAIALLAISAVVIIYLLGL